jgi:tetratricopeptide (TPR) repeat protein
VVAAGLVVLALVAGVVGTTAGLIGAEAARRAEAEERWAAERARDEKELARQDEADQRRRAETQTRLAEAATKRAETQRAVAEAVSGFLQSDLLGQADGTAQALRRFPPDPQLTVRVALDRAARRVGDRFRDQPEVEASIRSTIGEAYLGVGDYKAAVEQLRRAAELFAQVKGPGHPTTLSTLGGLARAYSECNRPADALAIFERLRNLREAQLGPNHPDTLDTLHNLAGAYGIAGRMGESISLLERVRDAYATLYGPDDPKTVLALGNLAATYMAAGRSAEAIPLYERVRAAQLIDPGPDHTDTVTTGCNLARGYHVVGRTADAIAAFDQVLPKARQVFGPLHPKTVGLTDWYLRALEGAGQFGRAAEVGAEHLAEQRKVYPAGDPRLARTLSALGNYLLKSGKPAEAETALRESVTIRDRNEPDLWTTFRTRSLLGQALTERGKYAEAEPLLLSGYEGIRQRGHKFTTGLKGWLAEAADRLVRLYELTARPADAERWRAERAKYPAATGEPSSADR